MSAEDDAELAGLCCANHVHAELAGRLAREVFRLRETIADASANAERLMDRCGEETNRADREAARRMKLAAWSTRAYEALNNASAYNPAFARLVNEYPSEAKDL